MNLNDNERSLLNLIQQDLPLIRRPFEELGVFSGMSEAEVLTSLAQFKERHLLRDIAPLFYGKSLGYKSTLVTLKVPEPFLDSVIDRINSHPGVSHNYQRNHSFNVWFTLSIPSENSFDREIESMIRGTPVKKYLILSSLKMYKLRVNFNFTSEPKKLTTYGIAGANEKVALTEGEKALVRLYQHEIPLVAAPWKEYAAVLGITEERVLKLTDGLKRKGVIKRISGIIKHRSAGFAANGMTCFNLPEEAIDRAGKYAAEHSQVSHCYKRPVFPEWQYPLFAMIHGKDRPECESLGRSIAEQCGCEDYVILYSTREFKKERVKYHV